MKVLIAMDSFKGNLSSLGVAAIVEKGIKRVYEDAAVDKVAIADGGEGTLESINNTLNGDLVEVMVKGPMGSDVKAKYAIVDGSTAIIEMAEASGLVLVNEKERNPMLASTFGTGQLIIDALNKGCKKLIIAIGGSATNDGGAGMAKALGARFLDSSGNEIPEGVEALQTLHEVDMRAFDKRIANTEFLVACDVTNPLTGESGASKVFGPQKGATDEMIAKLDKSLEYFSEIVKKQFNKDMARVPGAGAAGGLGYGLMAFCGAKLKRGIDLVLDTVKLENRILDVDVVITGEGRLDGQTVFGKVPVGVAGIAKKHGKPVYAIAGFIGEGGQKVYDHGIDAVMSSMVGPLDLDKAIRRSPQLIEEAAERLFRIIKSAPRVC